MNYGIKLSKAVLSQFKKIPDDVYLKIRDGVNMLKENPRPIGCKKLTNEEGYRIRVGKYRILYTVDDRNLLVSIYRIAHRKDVYR